MNYEIEQKAHVYNRQQVIDTLNKVATYNGTCHKTDEYYRIPLSDTSEKAYISCRFRQEVKEINGTKTTENIFTYKREKSIISSGSNSTQDKIEVNQELESLIQNPQSFKIFIQDLGAVPGIIKQKDVLDWNYNVDGFEAHIELCTVPPLGDFLEIEIIAQNNTTEYVGRAKSAIQKIFTLCNIPLTQIEPKYYRDLLNMTKNIK